MLASGPSRESTRLANFAFRPSGQRDELSPRRSCCALTGNRPRLASFLKKTAFRRNVLQYYYDANRRASVSDAVPATCASPLVTQIALQLFRADLPVSTSRASHDDCQQNHCGPDFDDPGVRDTGDLLWPKHPAR